MVLEVSWADVVVLGASGQRAELLAIVKAAYGTGCGFMEPRGDEIPGGFVWFEVLIRAPADGVATTA